MNGKIRLVFVKKTVAVMVCILVILGSIHVTTTTVFAEGWIDHVQGTMNYNTTYSFIFDNSDYHRYNDHTWGHCHTLYYKTYKFQVPQNGNIELFIETEEDDYFAYQTVEGIRYGSAFYIYSASDLDNEVWSVLGYEIEASYSSARGVYYESFNLKLNKGTYYLVATCIEPETTIGPYQDGISLTLDYSPSISAPRIKKVTGGKKKIVTKWNRVSDVSGYELQYSLKKNFKRKYTKTLTLSSTATKKTIKKLKSKKNYYVRIRSIAIVNVNGRMKTYRSRWSEVRSVKTK